jgi:hypothetical protein
MDLAKAKRWSIRIKDKTSILSSLTKREHPPRPLYLVPIDNGASKGKMLVNQD